MEKTFALIQGSVVVNAVVANDSYIDFVRNDYTSIVDVTDLYPMPSVGTLYDAETGQFTFPQVINEPDVITTTPEQEPTE